MKQTALFLLFCLTIRCCLGADSVKLDNSGRLTVSDLVLLGDHYTGKRNVRQGVDNQQWQVTRTDYDDTKGVWHYSGKLVLYDNDPSANYEGTLKRTAPDEYTYDFIIRNSMHDFSFRFSMQGDTYRGRIFKVDNLPQVMPMEKREVQFRSATCTKLAIPASDGVLTLENERPFNVRFHDYRPRPATFSIMMDFPRTSPEVSEFHFKIKYEKFSSTPLDIHNLFNIGKLESSVKWDSSILKSGVATFHGTRFSIVSPKDNQDRRALALRGRQTPQLPLTASVDLSRPVHDHWLFLLHAQTEPVDANAPLGSLTIRYEDGTRSTFNLQSGRDCGCWLKPGHCPNAEVVWLGETPETYAGLYRSAFPLEDKPVAGLDFASAGQSTWMVLAASTGNLKPPANTTLPYFLTASENWQPIDFAKEVEPGSVMDFSWRLDAPAGKYGPVMVRDNHFVFRDRPDTPVRFYGTNICSGGQYVNKEWAERLASRMAQYGFNILRQHHHDGGMTTRQNTMVLDPVPLDQLDYLIFCLKQKGIYTTTDLYISRRLPKGEIPEYPTALTNIQAYKAMFWILDSVWENWKEYCRQYLNHVNPYTGLAIKDEPSLVCINIINEGNIKSQWQTEPFTRQLYLERFSLWKQQRKLDFDDNNQQQFQYWFDEFLTETYENRYRQMLAFLREQGVKCALSDQNMGSSPKLSHMRRLYDYVDNHGYKSHPSFPVNRWQLPSQLTQESVLNGRQPPVPGGMFPTRLFDKPYTIMEFDYAKPNIFRAEGPVVMGAYASLQGWDMLVQFAYSHGREDYQLETRAGNHFDLSTDPVKLLAHRIGTALFMPGGIPKAPQAFVILLDGKEHIPFSLNFNPLLHSLGGMARVGCLVRDEHTGRFPPLPDGATALIDIGCDFPKNLPAEIAGRNLPVIKTTANDNQLLDNLNNASMLAPGCYDAASKTYRTQHGSVVHNASEQTFTAVSESCESLILPAGKALETKHLKVENKLGRGVFAIMTADGKPLETTSRALFMHLTNTFATKIRFANANLELLESWGVPPFLAERGEARVTFKFNRPCHLYAINTSGKRLAEIPLAAAGFDASVFNPFGQVFCYEVVF